MFVNLQIQLKEVVLEENDVSKAIIEYVNLNHISNIAVGAPNKLVFTFARYIFISITLELLTPPEPHFFCMQKI